MTVVEGLIAGVLGAVILLSWAWVVHRIFVVEPKIRKAQRDVNKAALQSLGQDRLRPMDVNPK